MRRSPTSRPTWLPASKLSAVADLPGPGRSAAGPFVFPVCYHSAPRDYPVGAVRVPFLLLLLANLLFLAWTRWVAPPAPGASQATPQASTPLRPIRLQQEAAGGAGTAGGSGVGAHGDDVAAASCVSVGPFLEQSPGRRRVVVACSGSGSPRGCAPPRTRSGSVYWVRVPDLATPADATNALAALQAAGLADAYVIADEAPGNVVSIGVFADPRRAAEVARTVASAGFTPQTRTACARSTCSGSTSIAGQWRHPRTRRRRSAARGRPAARTARLSVGPGRGDRDGARGSRCGRVRYHRRHSARTVPA